MLTSNVIPVQIRNMYVSLLRTVSGVPAPLSTLAMPDGSTMWLKASYVEPVCAYPSPRPCLTRTFVAPYAVCIPGIVPEYGRGIALHSLQTVTLGDTDNVALYLPNGVDVMDGYDGMVF